MAKQPDAVSADTAFGTAAGITIGRLYDQMASNLDGTVVGSDIEALHDMRVASRRLRAALRVFKACLPSKELQAVVAQVRAVTLALGSVRDHDVFIEYLEEQNAKYDDDIGWLIDAEKADREQSRSAMLSALDDLAHGSLHADINRMLAKTSMVNARKWRNHFAAQALGLINPRLRSLVDLSYSIYNPALMAEIHQMRIAAKQLRYSMEAFIPCFGEPLNAAVAEVKLLQEQLGRIHDCDVWVEKLRGYQNDPNPEMERMTAVYRLIEDREKRRSEAYEQAFVHWQDMGASGFPTRLRELVSYSSADMRTKQGGIVLEEEKQLEVTGAGEAPAKKPARRRAPAKKAVKQTPAVEAEALAGVAEETPAQTSEPLAVVADQIEVVAVEQTPAEPAAVPLPAPSEPQHPGIAHLKELVKDATAHLSGAKTMTSRMSKQMRKLEGDIEKLPGRLRKISIKEAAKAEKYLFRLREHIAEIPKSDLTRKGIDKLSQESSALRKKLPTGKK